MTHWTPSPDDVVRLENLPASLVDLTQTAPEFYESLGCFPQLTRSQKQALKREFQLRRTIDLPPVIVRGNKDLCPTCAALPAPTKLPLEGIHGLLILLTEAIGDDVETLDIKHQTGELQITWQGKGYWCQFREGEAPFMGGRVPNDAVLTELRRRLNTQEVSRLTEYGEGYNAALEHVSDWIAEHSETQEAT